MPGYVEQALEQFQHLKPKSIQHAPHQWNRPIYGQRIQYVKPDKTKKTRQNRNETDPIDCWQILVSWKGNRNSDTGRTQ